MALDGDPVVLERHAAHDVETGPPQGDDADLAGGQFAFDAGDGHAVPGHLADPCQHLGHERVQ